MKHQSFTDDFYSSAVHLIQCLDLSLKLLTRHFPFALQYRTSGSMYQGLERRDDSSGLILQRLQSQPSASPRLIPFKREIETQVLEF